MPAYTRLRSLLTAAGATAEVRAWVHDYLADVAAGVVEVVAVRHPLGFTCFPVWRQEARGICLHVWSTDRPAAPTTSMVHAHSWNLVSHVLYGTVVNEIIDVSADSDAGTHRVFEVRSDTDGDTVHATRRSVRYRSRSREVFRDGDVYTLPHSEFHVTDVLSAAATIVLGEHIPGELDLSLGDPGTTDHRVERTPHSSQRTRELAEAVLARLRTDCPANGLEERCDTANS
ncbi:hypothetical protein ACFWF3_15935 [Nocardia sp. NPDC060220]|uniref:hypothetical protein n=1 Tax=Nocardia sp. NPDC060220 TaxID=3347076 RepID=UPI00366403CE